MTTIEIIDETVEYYSADTNRRSVNIEGTECVYNGPDGKLCAFSRCVLPTELYNLIEGSNASEFEIHGSLDYLLIEQYRGHAPSFWVSLQSIHDNTDYWSIDGLTSIGRSKVDEIKRMFNDK